MASGRRFGEPADIAYGVLYLASDESSFITGTELVIDGGWTAQ
jgi:NAD(P)-dependent dehydrogenase (short-subunit alcohol dehydrogenase family)